MCARARVCVFFFAFFSYFGIILLDTLNGQSELVVARLWAMIQKSKNRFETIHKQVGLNHKMFNFLKYLK